MRLWANVRPVGIHVYVCMCVYIRWMEEILHQVIGGFSVEIPWFIGFLPSQVVQDFATIHSMSRNHFIRSSGTKGAGAARHVPSKWQQLKPQGSGGLESHRKIWEKHGKIWENIENPMIIQKKNTGLTIFLPDISASLPVHPSTLDFFGVLVWHSKPSAQEHSAQKWRVQTYCARSAQTNRERITVTVQDVLRSRKGLQLVQVVTECRHLHLQVLAFADAQDQLLESSERGVLSSAELLVAPKSRPLYHPNLGQHQKRNENW